MSANDFLDACGFIPASSGTGNFVVSAAITGYQTPASAGAVNGNVYSYRAQSADLTQWEEGFGTYTTSSTTLARTTITSNSSGGTSAINFSAAPNVFIVQLSQDIKNASLLSSGNVAGKLIAALMRSYLAGLTLSTAGSSATFSVAAGVAVDSTSADIISLATSISKTTGAWTAGSGNGALDTSTIAASTWYHVHLIKNTTSGAVDVLVSLSATTPTLPTGYTLARRIGSMKTNASSQWLLFHQFGDFFLWDVPVNDYNTNTSITSTPANYVISVPTGVNVLAKIRFDATNSAGGTQFNVYSPVGAAQTTLTPNFWNLGITTASVYQGIELDILTDTSAHIAIVGASAANNTFFEVTLGWRDRRGQDA